MRTVRRNCRADQLYAGDRQTVHTREELRRSDLDFAENLALFLAGAVATLWVVSWIAQRVSRGS